MMQIVPPALHRTFVCAVNEEDQENHCPPKMVNGYDSEDSDSEKKTFNLSRKTRRAVQNFNGGDSVMDS